MFYFIGIFLPVLRLVLAHNLFLLVRKVGLVCNDALIVVGCEKLCLRAYNMVSCVNFVCILFFVFYFVVTFILLLLLCLCVP